MAIVTNYHLLLHDNLQSNQTSKAQIILYDGNDIVAQVKFNEVGIKIPKDDLTDNIIYMNLPGSLFQDVLYVLQNEAPVSVYFAQNRGFLTSNKDIRNKENLTLINYHLN
jgi:hypothetical protein